jgi:LuxR family transcriptional regulator, maltose regulon positive regulatory protein
MTSAYSSELPLIRTKLAPPRMGSAPISRDALLEELDGRRTRKLTVVQGPAGCGKTMLLAQWRKHLYLQGAAVAWYNVSVDDDDAQIAAYIVESLRHAGLPVETDGVHAYVRSGGKAVKALLTSLVNDISDHGGEVYLFIDDFQYVSSFATLRMVDRWLTLAPPNFHLVLGTRTRPPIDLPRLTAEDQLTELRFSELRFDLTETERFVASQGLSQLTPSQVSTLHEMTDGWAAGLQLMAFSLRKERTPAAFFERQAPTLSLSQEQALNDYLNEAVAKHLTDEELGFLIHISVCRRFNRELCELLTGNPRAAEYLAKFEAENLFLLPIDTTDTEPWYRFHRLFASFLNKRLQALEEPELRKLHLLASHWFGAKHFHLEALRHARAAHDMEFLVELIDRVARRMLVSANFLQLLEQCAAVPREYLRTRLNVCMCAAWAQLSCARIVEFDRTIEDISRHPGHAAPEVVVETQLLKAYRLMSQDDTAASLKLLEPLMRQPPLNSALHTQLLSHIASHALVHAHRFEEAREVTRWPRRHRSSGRRDHTRPLVDVVEGFSHLVQGNIREAVAVLMPSMNHPANTLEWGADAAGVVTGYIAEACYQADEIAIARAFLNQNSELIDAVGTADGVLYAYRVQARLEQLEGAWATALRTLRRLEEMGYQRDLDRLVAWSLYEQHALALRARHGASPAELRNRLDGLAERYRDQPGCAWSEIRLASLLARADFAFEHTSDASCVAQIEAADIACRALGRQLLSVRLSFMRAVTILRCGDSEQALVAGKDAVRIANEAGMMRVIADLGVAARPLLLLLAQIGWIEPERQYVEAALRSISAGLESSAQPVSPSPPIREGGALTSGILSQRECEVVALLSKALSTKSIARVLNLSSGTVKWHLKNIYAKLNAVAREDALAKARALGIIR